MDKEEFMTVDQCSKKLKITNSVISAILALCGVIVILVGFSLSSERENTKKVFQVKEDMNILERTVSSHIAAQAVRDKHLVNSVEEIKDSLKDLHQELKNKE